jgi:uncharacterized protein (TIGR03083 family)
MNETITRVENLRELGHHEWMSLADNEYERLLQLVDTLTNEQWSRPTDCPEWDVRDIVAHLIGMCERNADKEEAQRQGGLAAAIVQKRGGLRIDALTGLQVRERSQLSPAELVQTLRPATERSLRRRRASTPAERAATYVTDIPGERPWTAGYASDVIQTRDPWIHRVDICRASGHELVLTPDHDGRIVADVVREWAGRHGRGFTLMLEGPAGGTYASGDGAEHIRLDAVEFCRVLSGRGTGSGLLKTRVPF